MAPTEETCKSISAVQEEETMAQVALMAGSITFPMVMKAAIELGLLEIIAGAGHDTQLTAAEVTGKLPVKENPQAAEMVERILRLLVAFSVVSCSVDVAGGETRILYGLTPAGRWFVKDGDGVSMAPLLTLHTEEVVFQGWRKVKEAVLEGGIAFNKAHNMNLFEYPAIDSRYNEVFNSAMYNHTTIYMKKILQSYEGFAGINKLMDVGGGLGHNLELILSKYPNIKGINFDLPHVIEHAVSHPGIEHVGGDMFEAIPNAEAIVMKWILHNWDTESCVKLLKNCHKAIPDSGKMIVIDSILPEVPEATDAAKLECVMDLVMMTLTPGGKERTKKEFLALAKAAGFSGIRFECHVFNLWVLEFYK